MNIPDETIFQNKIPDENSGDLGKVVIEEFNNKKSPEVELDVVNSSTEEEINSDSQDNLKEANKLEPKENKLTEDEVMDEPKSQDKNPYIINSENHTPKQTVSKEPKENKLTEDEVMDEPKSQDKNPYIINSENHTPKQTASKNKKPFIYRKNPDQQIKKVWRKKSQPVKSRPESDAAEILNILTPPENPPAENLFNKETQSITPIINVNVADKQPLSINLPLALHEKKIEKTAEESIQPLNKYRKNPDQQIKKVWRKKSQPVKSRPESDAAEILNILTPPENPPAENLFNKETQSITPIINVNVADKQPLSINLPLALHEKKIEKTAEESIQPLNKYRKNPDQQIKKVWRKKSQPVKSRPESDAAEILNILTPPENPPAENLFNKETQSITPIINVNVADKQPLSINLPLALHEKKIEKTAEESIQPLNDINIKDENGNSPLHLACEAGQHDLAFDFIQRNADINAENKEKDTPLHLACSKGYLKTVEVLIQNNARINLTGEFERSPLHLACLNGHVETVKVLIENNAAINVQDVSAQSPLHLACLNGHVETVKVLIENNAIENNAVVNSLQDSFGNTPLHLAYVNYLRSNDNAEKAKYEEIIKFLLEQRADCKIKNSAEESFHSLFLNNQNLNTDTDTDFRSVIEKLINNNLKYEQDQKLKVYVDDLFNSYAYKNPKVNSEVSSSPFCFFVSCESTVDAIKKSKQTFLEKSEANPDKTLAESMHENWKDMKSTARNFVLVNYQLDFVRKYKEGNVSTSDMYAGLKRIKNALANVYPEHDKAYTLIHKAFSGYLKYSTLLNRTFDEKDIYGDKTKHKQGFAVKLLENLKDNNNPKKLNLSDENLNKVFDKLIFNIGEIRIKNQKKSYVNKKFSVLKPSSMIKTLNTLKKQLINLRNELEDQDKEIKNPGRDIKTVNYKSH